MRKGRLSCTIVCDHADVLQCICSESIGKAENHRGYLHRRQTGKEAQQSRVVRVALLWLIPRMGVQAEEELDVLDFDQSRVTLRARTQGDTYTHSVGQGAIHVSQKEVSELNGV